MLCDLMEGATGEGVS